LPTSDELERRNGWFVCAVMSGYEYIVVEEIKKLMEEEKWEGIIRDVFVPMEEVTYKNGTKRNKVMPIYKRTVFINMVLTQSAYHAIKEVRGFLTPLPPREPTPVPLEQMEKPLKYKIDEDN